MMQPEMVGPVESAVGYVLKQASVALRAAMDAALRPLHLTVPQYACLELLASDPSELAGGAFITRQSKHAVLPGLEEPPDTWCRLRPCPSRRATLRSMTAAVPRHGLA